MDGAVGRVDLRGLRLLERSRALRRDEAQREFARTQDAVVAAAAAEAASQQRLLDHRAAWRAHEEATFAASVGRTVAGRRFRDQRDGLDQLADKAILLAKALDDARSETVDARSRADAARAHLARQQRRLQQSEAVTERVSTQRADAALTAEEQEIEDGIAQRHGARRPGGSELGR